ncbi:MAG: Asp-tRNA(Asn)/Glu-tRNA(Gln) amidotransferase subunit GatC [Spirochaetia bacterium]
MLFPIAIDTFHGLVSMFVTMDRNELLTTASLAHVELSDAELEKFEKNVTQLLEYFDVMNSVDVTNLEPTTHALVKENRLRTDRVTGFEKTDDLVENAEDIEDRFIVIPNVL